MTTTAEAAKTETKKSSRKKGNGKAAKKTTPRRAKAAEGDGPMPGKKLLQSWVDEAYHEYFSKMATKAALRPATYLRQLVHNHVDQDKAAKKEMGS